MPETTLVSRLIRYFRNGPVLLNALLMVISALAAWRCYPWLAYQMFLGIAAVCLCGLLLPRYWTVGSLMIGIYFGLMMDSPVKSGTKATQLWNTFESMMKWGIIGLLIGILIDIARAQGKRNS